MGKGDQRSRRGKIWRGTFGKRRPKKSNSIARPAITPETRSPKPDKPKRSKTVEQGMEPS